MNTYIIDSIRTPIGKFGGTLKDIRTDDLGAIPIKELIKRTGIDPSKIDDVILGCANQAGEDNRNIARMALILAGVPTYGNLFLSSDTVISFLFLLNGWPPWI